MYKIGIFTRYSMKKDLYDGYHGSPYKIFKITGKNERKVFYHICLVILRHI